MQNQWCSPVPPAWVTTENMWVWWGMRPWAWLQWQGSQPCPPEFPDPWKGWVSWGGLTQLGKCSGGCPQGCIPGVAGWKGTCRLQGCPWLCRGCQAGWAYDQNFKHIGPVKYPHSNRFDCNRVKWLGAAGAPQ